MEIQKLKERYHIKVNKKHKSIISPSHLVSDDILYFNDQPQTRNLTNNLKLLEMNNWSQNGINNNYLTEVNYPLTSTNKDLKYDKINNSKRFNKNDYKQNLTSKKIKKYKKKIIEDNIGKKKMKYKSESQYPLNKKMESYGEKEQYINNPIIKPLNSKPFNKTKKIDFNQRIETRNKKNSLKDYNNNSFLKNKYNKHNYSRFTHDKLRHNFTKPLKKESYDQKESLSNSHSFDNYHNVNINNNTINEKNLNEINNYYNNYNNNLNKNNNNNKSKDNNFINIYKNKLVNIFVRLLKYFFDKYYKNITMN